MVTESQHSHLEKLHKFWGCRMIGTWGLVEGETHVEGR